MAWGVENDEELAWLIILFALGEDSVGAAAAARAPDCVTAVEDDR